jgi:hypothetical protein
MKVITADATQHQLHSPKDFERVLRIRYLKNLEADSLKTHEKIRNKCEKAYASEWITPRQKWLGAYYAKELRAPPPLDLTIAWMNDRIGYGVWTSRTIEPRTFVGEYIGVLRRRRFFGRWSNHYCFDYTIGPHRSSSFVIDCQKAGNHTRYINHSYQPNLDLTSVYFDGMMRVILIANREIPAGAQLCYDYGEDYWAKRGRPLNLCG